MLLPLLVGTLLFVLAAFIVAKASLRIMRRLGLEIVPVLLWLGILEEPLHVPRSQRRRLGELLLEPRVTPAPQRPGRPPRLTWAPQLSWRR